MTTVLDVSRPTQVPDMLTGGPRLALFVFGPGVGESVALCVRSEGDKSPHVLVVDSCALPGRRTPPVLELLARYDASIQHFAITHRHADHIEGADRVLGHMRTKPLPGQHVLIADRYVGVGGSTERQDATTEQHAGALTPAIAALRDAVDHVDATWTKLDAWSGTQNLSLGSATIKVLAPGRRITGPVSAIEANHRSIVLQVEWHDHVLVLTGDATGRTFGEIGRPLPHDTLKVPHHGSRTHGSLHVDWTSGALDRRWVCTPYAPRTGLPPIKDPRVEELPSEDLLDHVDHVLLTSLPVRHSFRLEAPATLTRAQYNDERAQRAQPGGREMTRDDLDEDWIDSMWCVELEPGAEPVLRRGRSTVILRRDAAPEVPR